MFSENPPGVIILGKNENGEEAWDEEEGILEEEEEED